MGKNMYRAACDLKNSWDDKLTPKLDSAWEKWVANFNVKFTVPRSIPAFKDEIHSVDLHAFADASLTGVSAAVYVVAKQADGHSQGLLTSKSRLSKKDTTIPRLELVAAHMAATLLENTKSVLQKYPINRCYGWSDSTVILY